RPDPDPAAVAEHARLGDDPVLAARWLRVAAARAAERFDHATAEDLLDQSLALVHDHETLVARAQVRIRRGRYRDAEADVVAATEGGDHRWEVGAWAAYFDRRFDDALRYADDGALAADDQTRAGCLVASGRILHARGDLEQARAHLTRAMDAATGTERLEAAAWLGVLQAHRSRPDQAIDLLRPITRAGVRADLTTAYLHALLFTGHASAVAGRPAAALDCFARYGSEVARRDVPRFAGRGANFSGWVLRNLGATDAGLDRHHEALAETVGGAIPEVAVSVLEDLADERIRAGDPDAAAGHLAQARTALHGALVFGWRLEMRWQLLSAQERLLSGAPEEALRIADGLRDAAVRSGVPRYDAAARLVSHRARNALGEPVDLDVAERDLDGLEHAVKIEAWWWAGQLGADLGQPTWVERAERMAADLARAAGPHGDTLRAEADRQLPAWKALSER
uniref:hypothetical protein n=1 Tax=Nocardioides stalactiti TaxID=2755356 RepID=UPI0015FEE04E